MDCMFGTNNKKGKMSFTNLELSKISDEKGRGLCHCAMELD